MASTGKAPTATEQRKGEGESEAELTVSCRGWQRAQGRMDGDELLSESGHRGGGDGPIRRLWWLPGTAPSAGRRRRRRRSGWTRSRPPWRPLASAVRRRSYGSARPNTGELGERERC